MNGKAKEDFESWLRKQPNFIYNKYTRKIVFMGKILFEDLPSNIKNAFIIEWIDSVGVTVDVIPRLSEKNGIAFEPNTFCVETEFTTEDFEQFSTRQEATEKAIEVAVNIYNEKQK